MKSRIAILTVISLLIISTVLTAGRLPFTTRGSEKAADYGLDELMEMMKQTAVEALVNQDTNLRAGIESGAKLAGPLPRGSRVEILMDRQEEWYYVRDLLNDKKGWVRGEALDIPPDEPADESRMSKIQLEAYANAMGYDSKTGWLILVDIRRQQTHIFKGRKGKWTLNRSMIVSTGKNTSPTIRGQFILENRGLWFYSQRLGSGGKFWVRFQGAYLFHSVAMDKDGNIIDNTLGQKSSNGCVRLSLDEAEWFFRNVADGSRVVIL